MRNLIIINGYAGAGKDTFVKYVADAALLQSKAVFNLSSIAPIWTLLRDGLGINMDAKGPLERRLAAEVKAALDNYNFHATRMVLDMALDFMNVNSEANVFLHMREPRAIEFSEEYCSKYPINFKTVFVLREKRILSVGNIADDNVDKYQYQYYIDNSSSLEDLQKQAIAFTNYL